MADKNTSGRIELYRANHGWVDRNRAFEVLVDGVAQASVYPRQRAEIPVQEGSHQVAVQFDGRQSDRVEVVVVAGATKRLMCSSRPGAAWFNPLLLGRAITLKLYESPGE